MLPDIESLKMIDIDNYDLMEVLKEYLVVIKNWFKRVQLPANYTGLVDNQITDITCPFQAWDKYKLEVFKALPECLRLINIHGLENCLQAAERVLISEYTTDDLQSITIKDLHRAAASIYGIRAMHCVFLFQNDQPKEALLSLTFCELETQIAYKTLKDVLYTP